MKSSARSPYVHSVYYPSWHIYRDAPPSTMDCSRATHLFYAFALVSDTGIIHHLDEHVDTQLVVDGVLGCMRAITQLKTMYPDLKVLLSIGGSIGSGTFPIFSATVEGRQSFAISAKTFVEKFNFDGIDIDWEHPLTPEHGRNYLSLLTTLRTHLPGHLLFSALPAGEWCLRNIDMKGVSNILDRINLMCYDFAGPWSQRSGHQAQLFARDGCEGEADEPCGSKAIEYLLSCGVASAKIVMGVPVYGRSFPGAQGPKQIFTMCSTEEGVFEYKNLPRSGSPEIVDCDLVAAYCLGGDDGFVTYDTPATVTAKALYVREKSLGGLFYWTGTMDSNDENRSLIKAGYTALFAESPKYV